MPPGRWRPGGWRVCMHKSKRAEAMEWLLANSSRDILPSQAYDNYRVAYSGISLTTFREAWQRLWGHSRGAYRVATQVAQIKSLSSYYTGVYPSSPVASWNEQVLEIDSRCCLILSDLHCPYHDPGLLREAHRLGTNYGVDSIILNGDLIDAASVSKFPAKLFGQQLPVGEEIEILGEILNSLQEITPNLIILLGNHEARLFSRLLNAELSSQQFTRLLTPDNLKYNLRLSPLGYLNLNGTVRVTHPGNASVIPTAVGGDIALQVQRDVVAGHGHTIGYRRSRGGQYTVIDSGGMFDASRLDYLVALDRRRPLTNQGFVIACRGEDDRTILRLIDPRNVDWGAENYLACYYRER